MDWRRFCGNLANSSWQLANSKSAINPGFARGIPTGVLSPPKHLFLQHVAKADTSDTSVASLLKKGDKRIQNSCRIRFSIGADGFTLHRQKTAI
jgi:hypothetical protein